MPSKGGNDGGIVIQERDRRLLEELSIMRVVDREQAKIAGGFNSTTRVNTRLLALTRAGLLRRFFLGAAGSGRKALYALSKRGASTVGVPARGTRRKHDSVLIADHSVSHQLALNDIYCALKFRALPHPVSFGRWITFSERLSKDFRLMPDAYFEIKTPEATTAAFLEIDLGHERLAIWKEKIKKYLDFATSGDYERQFGGSQFRVLVIANSERRLLSIRKTVRASTQKVFWFATMESFQLQGLLAAIWLRPDSDELQPLIPPIQKPS